MANHILKKHQEFFEAGKTFSISFRKKQLKSLKRAIKNRESELENAMKLDLGKNQTEGYAAEIGLVYEEIRYAISHLNEWVEPKRASSNIGLFPTTNKVTPTPKGVALIIAPWNYPVQLVLAPLVAAISAGCVCVIKPSEDAPNCEKVIKSLIEETFAPEYISCITGIGADVVPPIIESGLINHVFFTGSTSVGKIIAKQCAEQLITSTLELGGKSPAIVDETANIKIAGRRIAWGKFYNAGQTCIAPDYVLVRESKKTELEQAIISSIEEFYGKNQEESNSYGRIINTRRIRALKSYLNKGNIVYGGKMDEESRYFAPTLIDHIDLESSIMKDEIFGPILPIISYTNESEIFEIVKRNRNPLALYLFTTRKRFENEIITKIPFGGGTINATLVHLVNTKTPFGGIGASGWGSYHGKAGFDAFTHYKSIAKMGSWVDVKLKYPPYNSLKDKLIRLILK